LFGPWENDTPLAGTIQKGTAMRLIFALFGLFVTVILASSLPAKADECYRTDSQIYSCSDPAFPRCGYNPSRNEWLCLADNQKICAGRALTWACASNEDCNGDGSAAPYCRVQGN
jgi:hypothetical protein